MPAIAAVSAIAMAEVAPAVDPELVERLNARIAELESRLAEQEQTVRHTLAMLVEWLETDNQIAA